jgi:putative Ca2+/H+ antiporter (TMEM165/GDT1 family)
MLSDLFIPFFSILLAEFGDKTQIAVISLSSKTKKHIVLFLGVISAFFIVDGLAVIFGDLLIKNLPVFYIKLFSGVLFILFGLFGLFFNNEEDKNEKLNKLKHPFFTPFFLILLAEFGDKSQIATTLFATMYNPILVFAGVMSALSFLSFLAIIFGKYLLFL